MPSRDFEYENGNSRHEQSDSRCQVARKPLRSQFQASFSPSYSHTSDETVSDGEKVTLAEIAHRLGRKALEEVTATAKPDTILGWYRKLIAKKFDSSKLRRSVGRSKIVRKRNAWSCRSGATIGSVSRTTLRVP
jgi:hypothetical protein